MAQYLSLVALWFCGSDGAMLRKALRCNGFVDGRFVSDLQTYQAHFCLKYEALKKYFPNMTLLYLRRFLDFFQSPYLNAPLRQAWRWKTHMV